MNKILYTIMGLLVTVSLYAADLTPTSNATPAPATAPMASTTPATSAMPATDKPANTGTVARAQFTTAVTDHEPTDNLTTLTNDATRIYYFTELKGMTGQNVTHRWEHDGKTMSEVKFDVAGPRWRVFSSKTLDPSWLGEWKASVVDADGKILSTSAFNYTKAAAATPASPTAPATIGTAPATSAAPNASSPAATPAKPATP